MLRSDLVGKTVLATTEFSTITGKVIGVDRELNFIKIQREDHSATWYNLNQITTVKILIKKL